MSLSPEHALPGVQDLPVGQPEGRGDDLGEKQPGAGGVLGLRVGHQVGDERLCELVLFGPDGERPAEIPAGDPGQETTSATAALIRKSGKIALNRLLIKTLHNNVILIQWSLFSLPSH